MPGSFLRFALLTGALALPGLTAYAPVSLAGQPTTRLSDPATTASGGTVLSMRPMAAESQPKAGIGSLFGAMTGGLGGSMGAGKLSSMLASGIGGGPTGSAGSAAGTPAPHGPAVEFTLLMGDGSTLTVVQSDDLGLHPGDRVRVIRGDPTRLVRAG